MNKLKSLQKKVIVGGENLLEKAEAQQKLLEESQKELEERQHQEARLKKAIEEKEVSSESEPSGVLSCETILDLRLLPSSETGVNLEIRS